jgi:mono/diheme cytochrome c family protein
MKILLASAAAAVAVLGCAMQSTDSRSTGSDALLKRGHYLAQIGGCNDCHTPGYMEKAGQVEEKFWLTGTSLGWQGPWGTTYPPNLRMHMEQLTEEQWLQEAHTREMRPPMPWYELRTMPDDDLRAIYRYIRSLGPVGEQAPAYLPPGIDPPLPAVKFVLPPGAGQ